MMPSRGVRLARDHAPRLYQLQCRNLSSAKASQIPRSRTRPAATALRPQTLHRHSVLAVPTIASIRHASTAPSPPPAQAATAPPTPIADPTPTPDISAITLDDIDLITYDISHIPEKIGYLHEIGLTWWYGPTSTLEFLLEHIHVYSGMPWWGSIAATAVVIRAVTFPFYLRASDSSARNAALVSVTKPISDRMAEAQRKNNTQELMLCWQQMMAVRKRAGISMTATFVPIILQGVLGFCGFKLIRAMSNLPVPAFKDGGFLWLSDLTVPDPYGVLPVVMAGAIHLLMRLGGESGAGTNAMISPGMQSFMFYGMPGVVMLIMAWQPGALCVWFTASGGLGMLQALMLQRPAVRRYFKLAPLYKPTKEEAANANPFKQLLDAAMPAPPQTDRPRPAIDIGGKYTGFMQPQWQAPNINTNASSPRKGQVLDVKGTSTSTASAEPKAAGGVSGFFRDFKERAQERSRENREKNERLAKRKAADAYEKRARERDGPR